MNNLYGLAPEEIQYLDDQFYICKSCLTLKPLVETFLGARTSAQKIEAINNLIKWEDNDK